jgi:hypothetical protein
LIQWVARFVYTDKTKCKHGQHQIWSCLSGRHPLLEFLFFQTNQVD